MIGPVAGNGRVFVAVLGLLAACTTYTRTSPVAAVGPRNTRVCWFARGSAVSAPGIGRCGASVLRDTSVRKSHTIQRMASGGVVLLVHHDPIAGSGLNYRCAENTRLSPAPSSKDRHQKYANVETWLSDRANPSDRIRS